MHGCGGYRTVKMKSSHNGQIGGGRENASTEYDSSLFGKLDLSKGALVCFVF